VARDLDGPADGGGDAPDVAEECQRVQALLAEAPLEQRDLILIDRLEKVYPAQNGQHPKMAVKALTLGVRSGECFGMLGPNGAGKTTSIHCLIGLMQPSAGNAFVVGHSIRSAMDVIYSLMGICPQHDILWEPLTARAHMEFYGAIKNLTGKRLQHAVTNGLGQVNLLNWIDAPVSSFSGGMKRRLSVAIALIGSNQVCYLDEPSTGLDPASRRTLWAVIKAAKRRSAMMLTTHSMEEAEELCDRLGIFIDGTLRCVGTPKALSARFGGYFTLSVTSKPDCVQKVAEVVQSVSVSAKILHSVGGTQMFEIPADVSLSQIFSVMTASKDSLGISDWGIASATLEESFIRLCTAAGASGV
jgi:ABC-type multidrug transport system ATPase subunit